MAASRVVRMRLLVQPDYVTCVIAQMAAARLGRYCNRWIACGAVGVTRYMGDLLLGQRILALVAEWCLLGPNAGG